MGWRKRSRRNERNVVVVVVVVGKFMLFSRLDCRAQPGLGVIYGGGQRAFE